MQETKLAEYVNFNIPAYSVVRKDGTFNRTLHRDVAIFIHNNIPYNVIDFQTPIHAIAIRDYT